MKHSVEYKGGQSRYGADAVDYMLVVVDGTELYAEAENDTWDEEKQRFADETATYDGLKAQITEQAQAAGINVDCLRFWYDE